MNTWKTIRIFVSSTFRDMQAERDWLVRFVFLRLRFLGLLGGRYRWVPNDKEYTP